MYRIGLNVQLSDWLCLNVHQSSMYGISLNVQNRPQCMDRPQCTPIRELYIEADPYIEAHLIYFLMWSVWANQTAVHWGRSIHWGRFRTLRPNLQSVCVWLLDIKHWTGMCLNVRNRPQCMDLASMYSSLIGVHWGRIHTIEANFVHWGRRT